MDLLQQIEAIIAPSLQDMGFEIIRIRFSGQKRMTLQIMVDRMDELPINVDECAEISHVVSALLDVDDPIQTAYRLEISSPGLDRPLTRPKDFITWQGFNARITLKWMQDGQKRFRGMIVNYVNDKLLLGQENGIEVELPFAQIEEAKLLLDDKLLEASKEKAKTLGVLEGAEGALYDE